MENDIPVSFIEDLNLFNNYDKTPPIQVADKSIRQMIQYCEDILSLYHSDSHFKKQAIGAYLKLLLIKSNNLCTLPSDFFQPNDSSHLIFKSLKQMVDDNYKQWHLTSNYANHLHTNTDHLNRVVKSLTVKTAKEINEAFNEYRLTEFGGWP